ncbi:ribosome maturation factor RimM [Thermospira aquatica]|uniref:Ribosome maturation factor RimM n=1 Tax=Thermospira aquatica TaxID=2828656 RepID=A0AAX3BAS0_9SPIR|nr:ribosome maturation factor RimM [Thermospira aquatica]URA09382.1 16S rRNA processing protein RimM [Thermospira aquatica]
MIKEPLVLIGRFTRPYGLKGQIKVQWYVDTIEDLEAFSRFYIEDRKAIGGYKEISFLEIKEYQKAYVATVAGMEDRTHAETLVGKAIYVSEEDLPVLPEGEFYIRDILGCEVLYEGEVFGVVDNFFEVGPRTLFIVRMKSGKSLAVPYEPRYFVKVDRVAKKIEASHLAELL